MSCLPQGIMILAGQSILEGHKNKFCQALNRNCHIGWLYPILPENLTLFNFGNLDNSRSLHLSKDASMSKLRMGTTLNAMIFWHFQVPQNFLTTPNNVYRQNLAYDNLFCDVCVQSLTPSLTTFTKFSCQQNLFGICRINGCSRPLILHEQTTIRELALAVFSRVNSLVKLLIRRYNFQGTLRLQMWMRTVCCQSSFSENQTQINVINLVI